MRNPLQVVVGVVIAALGVLFFLQGIGATGGSGGMNNTTTWSILGPIIAIIGIVVLVRGLRSRAPTDSDL